MLSTLTAMAGWSYLLIILLVAADAVFPLVPGELAVVSGGVLAASGRLNLPVLIAAAAVGAMAGDTLAYALGRGAGRLGVGRLLHQPRSRRALVWATGRLQRRAAPVLVAARFVPGGRTVTTLVAGFLRVPPRRFAQAVAVGGPMWAGYAVALGYLAGRAAADRPWVGILAAVTAVMLAGLAGEGIRRLWTRRRPGQPSVALPPPAAVPSMSASTAAAGSAAAAAAAVPGAVWLATTAGGLPPLPPLRRPLGASTTPPAAAGTAVAGASARCPGPASELATG
jgi:membrane protein DedA with SNARE-associated domain